jgi:phosphoglycerate dehydrogenase-like enzyme
MWAGGGLWGAAPRVGPVSVWTPFAPAELGPVADAVDVHLWDGGPLPADPAGVEFLVLPYTFDDATLEPVAAMTRLRAVQSLTAGVEHLAGRLPEGVVLCNARGVHDASTAELALALLLATLRGLPDFVRAQDRGEWAPDRRDSLADRRVLVVGAGSIGAAVARRLAPFECDVVLVASRARAGVHGTDELPALLPSADAVVLVVPLTDATRGMVDARFLAALPDGAVVVNVARGPVVDTAALLAELQTGRLRAALDVTDPEPLPADSPLWSAPGVLVVPHVGGNSTAFRPRALGLVREQVDRWVRGLPLLHVVEANPPYRASRP